MFKYNCLFTFLILCTFFSIQKVSAQEKTIYTAFNSFFEKEIKHQGIKGNWIYGLKEITAYHKFDYNDDGLNDILIEFNAEPVDEGNYTNYYSVLFENDSNEKYVYIDYIESLAMTFSEFSEGDFLFKKNNSKVVHNFSLTNSRFIEVN